VVAAQVMVIDDEPARGLVALSFASLLILREFSDLRFTLRYSSRGLAKPGCAPVYRLRSNIISTQGLLLRTTTVEGRRPRAVFGQKRLWQADGCGRRCKADPGSGVRPCKGGQHATGVDTLWRFCRPQVERVRFKAEGSSASTAQPKQSSGHSLGSDHP